MGERKRRFENDAEGSAWFKTHGRFYLVFTRVVFPKLRGTTDSGIGEKGQGLGGSSKEVLVLCEETLILWEKVYMCSGA